jgi:hypothetical protein
MSERDDAGLAQRLELVEAARIVDEANAHYRACNDRYTEIARARQEAIDAQDSDRVAELSRQATEAVIAVEAAERAVKASETALSRARHALGYRPDDDDGSEGAPH